MEAFATFERQKTVFRDHPMITEQLELKAAADLALPVGAIIKITSGVAALAGDTITVDDDVAIVHGPVTLNATTKTSTVVARHADVVKDQVTVAAGADVDTIAAVLSQKGLYIH